MTLRPCPFCSSRDVDVRPFAGKYVVEADIRRLLSAFEAQERLIETLTAAVEDAEETLRLVERPAFIDPRHGDEVKALGDRIGYGALMSSASASWREANAANHYPTGGEFVAGPCHATVVSVLSKLRTALAQAQARKG